MLGGVSGESMELAQAVSILSVGTAQHSGEGCLPARGRKCVDWQTSALSRAEVLLDLLLLLMIRKMKDEGNSSKRFEP